MEAALSKIQGVTAESAQALARADSYKLNRAQIYRNFRHFIDLLFQG